MTDPTNSGLRDASLRDARRTRRYSILDPLAVVPLLLLAFVAVAMVHPPQSGPLALALMLEEDLFIAVLAVFVPLALLARARVLGAALIVVVIVGGVSFGSEWISLPSVRADRHDLSAMTWNIQFGSRTPAEATSQLRGVTVDLIALEELEPDVSAAIDNDPAIAARYPYRAMSPHVGASGLAVLSRYPIEQVERSDDPATLALVVDAPRGPVHVIVAHPTHGEIDKASRFRLPVDFDPADRYAAIAALRKSVDADLAAGVRLLVLGDFNTAPSEAENAALTRGLRDTHVEVGQGPGWTWRPSRFDFLPFAFVRIDRQLTAGAIYPISTSVDCSLPGDHCRLFGDYEIGG